MKRCYKCHQVKDSTSFYRSLTRLDGLQSCCKSCELARVPERKRYSRVHYERNREAVLAKNRQWKLDHPERKVAIDQASFERTKDKRYTRYRAWAKANPLSGRVRTNRRRAQKVGNGGSHTAVEWLFVVALFRGRCAYCGTVPKCLHQDHVVPIVKGGTDDIENIVPACPTCNYKKRDRQKGWEPTLCLV